MALPKRRSSRAKVRTRRQQWKATAPAKTECPHCGRTILPHRYCPKCGRYGDLTLVAAKKERGKKQ